MCNWTPSSSYFLLRSQFSLSFFFPVCTPLGAQIMRYELKIETICVSFFRNKPPRAYLFSWVFQLGFFINHCKLCKSTGATFGCKFSWNRKVWPLRLVMQPYRVSVETRYILCPKKPKPSLPYSYKHLIKRVVHRCQIPKLKMWTTRDKVVR